MVEASERGTGRAPVDRTPPGGLSVALDRRVRILDGGAVLLGGAPPRMLRLAPAGRALLADGGFTVTDAMSAALAGRLLDAGVVHPVPGGPAPAGAPGGPTPAPAPRDPAPPAASGGPTPAPAPRGPASAGAPGAADPVPGPGPGAVTVVIPVRDRTSGVARLLAALPPEIGAVIVVDDGSADPAALRAVAERAGARVLCHDHPRGPAAARNAGLAAASTPLVAFLDSDVLPTAGWLAPLLAHLADPAVGLVAPRIVALDPVRGWLARYEAVRSSLDLGPDPAAVVPRSRVAYVPSAALLVRRAAVGSGFDERMQVAEDVDLVLRLHAAGWRLRYEPAARVAHEHRTNLRAWWLRKAYYGSGAAPLALRHPGAVPPMVLSPWSAAAVALLLARRPLPAAAVTAWATHRLARQLHVAHPHRTAARIIALALAGVGEQTADAITRHYWPLAVVACAVSRRARRLVATVALVEGLDDWRRHRRWDTRVRPGPLGHVLAHRLDDLAYGTGLWWGALRHRTLAPLRPVGPRFASTPAGNPSTPEGTSGATTTERGRR